MTQANATSDKNVLLDKLKGIHQEHLLDHWHCLSLSQKHHLAGQILALDTSFFLKQQSLLANQPPVERHYRPPSLFALAGEDSASRSQLGLKLLKEKKIACVVLAGGQGSRLKYDGPKGLFPLSPVKKKPLFQLMAEKVYAASQLAEQPLPIALMTSPLNHQQTLSFFETHDNFRLQPEQVSFFCQPLWPLLSPSGDLFLEDPYTVALGPNGNGCLSTMLYTSGLWEKWKRAGIEMVSVIPIDNPLALPFDTELCGFHALSGNEVTIKAALRQSPYEDVGVLVETFEGKTSVVEYSEIAPEDRFAEENGQLVYRFANIGLYCLSMDFIAHTANRPLPIYKARKHAKQLEPTNIEKNAWKFEEFIFDLFSYSNCCHTLVYSRDACFAPLKNLEGNYSPATVQKALFDRERQLFLEVTGKEISPDIPFELDAAFYYPSPKTASLWESITYFQESISEAS